MHFLVFHPNILLLTSLVNCFKFFHCQIYTFYIRASVLFSYPPPSSPILSVSCHLPLLFPYLSLYITEKRCQGMIYCCSKVLCSPPFLLSSHPILPLQHLSASFSSFVFCLYGGGGDDSLLARFIRCC